MTLIVGIRLTPWLMDRIADRTLVAGAGFAAIGFLGQAFVSPGSGYVIAILLPGIVFSFGGGLLNTPLTNIVTAGIPKSDAGAASGIMNTAKQIGGALGLAILVTLIAGSQLAPESMSESYGTAFLAIAIILLVIAISGFALPAKAHSSNN